MNVGGKGERDDTGKRGWTEEEERGPRGKWLGDRDRKRPSCREEEEGKKASSADNVGRGV